ncbi:c-type cytochrome [Oligoflexus tunisiensis]|uniref:c-type cytochrome n=1 Tax=Oligoflexus tunisiensis TaxID=708132 RepID=UPI00114CB4C0|nr:hypothetical protein [Oligoflexus tunisiensis]
MSRKVKAFSLWVCFNLVMGTWSCSYSEQNKETGSTQNASADAMSVPELVSKMTWSVVLNNVRFGKLFSGFDGTNSFKVLVDARVFGELPQEIQASEEKIIELYRGKDYESAAVAKAAGLSLEVDASFVTVSFKDISPGGRQYELTTQKAGSTSATFKLGSAEMPLALEIAEYTAAQVAAGKQRYNTEVTGETYSPACASCHRTDRGANHSPYLMANYSDPGLLATIEAGVNTDDNWESNIPHKMIFANDAEKSGIVPYLRSLDPNLLPKDQVQ